MLCWLCLVSWCVVLAERRNRAGWYNLVSEANKREQASLVWVGAEIERSDKVCGSAD